MTDTPVIGVDVSKYEVHDYRDAAGKVLSIKGWWSPDKSTKPIDFVMQRLSYGGKLDEHVHLMYSECVKVPIRIGYHYYNSGVKWQTQMDTILEASDGKVYHAFCIDYEKAYNNLNGTTFAEMMELTKQTRIETKKRTLNYFNHDVYKTLMRPYNADAVINKDDLWLAWYPYLPNLTKGPSKPDGVTREPEFWQFGAGDVPFTAGYFAGADYGSWRRGIDLNRWKGTLAELYEWADVDGTETPPVEPPLPGRTVTSVTTTINYSNGDSESRSHPW